MRSRPFVGREGVLEADGCLSIVAYWGSKRRRAMSVQVWGHAFGLSSAVHTYNRDPEFVPCVRSFDDRFSMDLGMGRGPAQTTLPGFALLARQKARRRKKHAAMSPTALLTGCELRLAEVLSAARFVAAAKPGRLEGVSAIQQTIWLAGRCTPTQTATLLGKRGFLSSQLQGRALRFAGRPFVKRATVERSGQLFARPSPTEPRLHPGSLHAPPTQDSHAGRRPASGSHVLRCCRIRDFPYHHRLGSLPARAPAPCRRE